MICMDRGYTDYDWWEELTRKGVYFVTRLKSNAVYDEIRRRAGRRSKHVVDSDTSMVIFLMGQFLIKCANSDRINIM